MKRLFYYGTGYVDKRIVEMVKRKIQEKIFRNKSSQSHQPAKQQQFPKNNHKNEALEPVLVENTTASEAAKTFPKNNPKMKLLTQPEQRKKISREKTIQMNHHIKILLS